MTSTSLLLFSIFLLLLDHKSQLAAFKAYFRLDHRKCRSIGHFRRPSLVAFSYDVIDFKPIYDPFSLSYSELRSDTNFNSGSEKIRAFLMNQLQIMLEISSSTTADLYFMQNWGDFYSDSEFHDLSHFHHVQDPSKVNVNIDYETPLDPDTFYRLASSSYSNNEMSLSSSLPVVYQNGHELFVSLILENRLYGIVRLYRCPFSDVTSWDSDFKSIDLVVRTCQGILQMLEMTKASSGEERWNDHMNFLLSVTQTVRTYAKMIRPRLRAEDKVGYELVENIIVQMDALQDIAIAPTLNGDQSMKPKVLTQSDPTQPKLEIALERELFKSSKTETFIDLISSDDDGRRGDDQKE